MFKDLFLLGGVVASVISPSFKDSITGSDIFFINGKYNVIENEEQYKKMTVDVSSNQMTGYDAMDKNFMMSQKSFNEIDEFQNFYVQINCMMEKNDNDDEIIDFIKYNIENNPNFSKLICNYFQKNNYAYSQRILNMILCSDINYFCAWYKRILNIAVRSNNKMLSNEAQGILDYYKEDFDEVF